MKEVYTMGLAYRRGLLAKSGFAVMLFAFLFSLSNVGFALAEQVNYDVNIKTSLNITIPSNLVLLTINPAVEELSTANYSVVVGTNNPTGYTLVMNATGTALKSAGGEYAIQTLSERSGGYTADNFETNKWGYKLSSGNYLPFVSGAQIGSSNAPTNGTTNSVTFAAKADTSLPAGAYEIVIDFAGVTNYVEPTSVDYCSQNSIADSNCMQKMDISQCTTTAKTVTDSRDGQTYLIQKLADNKCWLLDNLRLDPVASKNNMDSSNTNATDAELQYLKGSARGTTSDQYAVSGVSYWTEASSSYSKPWVAIKNAANNNWNPSTVLTAKYGAGSGKVGVYYNYCAASVGTYCWGDGTSSGTSSGNAVADVCPKGWRMPTGGSGGEYDVLYSHYNTTQDATSSSSLQYNLSTPLSGAFYMGSAAGQNGTGGFWGSTRSNDTNMHYLVVNGSNVGRTGGYNRNFGFSVRCVYGSKYLQDQTQTTLATLLPNVGDTTTFFDKRDGEPYLVGHLEDGKYWLLDNLRLDLTNASVLSNTTAATTNVSSETPLNKLKNGGGTATDQYPTARINNAAWSSQDQDYYSIPMMVKSGSVTSGVLENTWTGDYTQNTVAPVVSGAGSGKIGVYYNFCAASAGTYCWGDGTSEPSYPAADPNTESGYDIEGDLCPKGWRLPTGGAIASGAIPQGEYQSLGNVISGGTSTNISSTAATNFKDALSTPLSGFFGGGATWYQGSAGMFWSATYNNAGGIYALGAYPSNVSLQDSVRRNYGYSIRCVLR